MFKTSDSCKSVIAAIATAKTKFGPLTKRGHNAFLKAKYVVLDDILDATEQGLNESGLLVVQSVNPVTVEADGIYTASVTTRVYHIESGEFIEFTAGTPFEGEKGISLPQSLGKAITYLRRYALTALLALATEDDTDAQPSEQRRDAKPQQQAARADEWGEKQFVKEWQALYTEGAQAALLAALDGVPWADARRNVALLKRMIEDARVAKAAQAEDALAQQLHDMARGE